MKISRRTRFIGLVLAAALMATALLAGRIIRQEPVRGRDRLTDEEKAWLNQQDGLIYAADNNAPPLRFVDSADTQYKGVVVDYVNLLSLELGVNIGLYPLPWEEALTNLKEGSADLCDMFASPERAEHFLFTEPIYNLRAVVVTRKAPGPIGEMTFATQKGDYVNEWLLEHHPGIELVYVDNVSSALDRLLAGEVDAVAGDEPVVLYQIKNKQAEDALQIMDRPLYDKEVVFAIPKTKPLLLPILNKGIASIRETDQLERIQQKWFGISTPIVQSPDLRRRLQYLLAGGGVLLILVFAMFYWNNALKREVDRRTREVQSGRNDLQATLDGMKEFIVLLDLDLKAAHINRSFLDHLGLSRETAVGRSCADLFVSFRAAGLEGLVGTARSEGRILEREAAIGAQHYMIRIYPLKTRDGALKHILVVLQNVTREKLGERKLLQASKMAAIGQLVAGMGHEIRNPLGIIRNHSYLLRGAGASGNAAKSLDYIDGAVERANGIIDNLLEFSRLTDDSLQEVGLKGLVERIFELEAKTLMRRHIEHRVVCGEEVRILANRESLKHILINLISNAVDAIGERGAIEVAVSEEPETVAIKVSDTGGGIPETEMENIFNPFYTTKGPDKGTGLGLYIVYNEVKKLGGTIEAESDGSSGTVFEIRLPRKKGVEAS